MGWRHNELDKWTYYDDNTNEQKLGWQQIDGEYYYLYSDDIAKGWFKDKSDSNWYYFAPSKQVIDGKQWYKGQMLHGVWLDYKNKWYYFNEESGYGGFYKGQMIHSCTYTTPYGKTYQFDDEGALIEKQPTTISDKLVEGSKCFEGYYSHWYTGDGTYTIGYGTSTAGTVGRRVYNSGIKSCTQEQATQWFKEEMQTGCNTLINWLKNNNITLTQNQFDACADVIYNMGFGNFKKFGIADIVLGKKESTWNNWCVCITDCNGVKYQGLITRRKYEYEIYNNNNYSIRP